MKNKPRYVCSVCNFMEVPSKKRNVCGVCASKTKVGGFPPDPPFCARNVIFLTNPPRPCANTSTTCQNI